MPSGYTLAAHLAQNPYFCFHILNPCLDYLSHNICDDLVIIADFTEADGRCTICLNVRPYVKELIPWAKICLNIIAVDLEAIIESHLNEPLLPRIPMAQRG